ncbi:hypothetical protein BASA81_000623 [Batrachochytrium salamandrivorans]|nr:hypothetical protein BASA81_000623 [Batrachochytrium salamandrivorans]
MNREPLLPSSELEPVDPELQPIEPAPEPSLWGPEAKFLLLLLSLASLLDLASTSSLALPGLDLSDFKTTSRDVSFFSLARFLGHALGLAVTLVHFAPQAQRRHVDSFKHESESDQYESKLPQLGLDGQLDPKRAWERTRHADQKQTNLQQAGVLCAVFLFDTFTSVYSSVKTVEFQYSQEHRTEARQAVTFCSQILFANLEFFLLKKLMSQLQKERGRLVLDLHNHELFYSPKMPGHYCDVCHSRISGEAYRCRMCDFDACPVCFDKAWRASKLVSSSTSSMHPKTGAKPVSNMDYFFRALENGKDHWMLFTISALALILSSLLSLALPSYTGQILDSVYNTNREQFKHAIEFMILASSGISVLGIFQSATIMIAARRIAGKVRSDLFRSILAQDIAFFDAQMSGQLTSRLTNDVAGMVAPWSTIFNVLTSSSFMLVGGFVMCLHTSWKLSALSFASVGPIIFLTQVYSEWSAKINREIYSALGDANSVATESLQNIRTVRAFSTEQSEIQKFVTAVENALRKGTKDALAGATTTTLTGFVDLATSVLILGFGGWTAMDGDSNLTAGKLLQFQLYYQMIDSSWKSLNGVVNSLTRAAGAAQRVLGLMDSLPDIDLDAGVVVVPGAKPPQLEFHSVVFRYPTRPESLVLNEVSFVCEAGTTTALVGPSGGGKSTMIALLMRLYDPVSGVVSFNGQDMRAINVRSMHEQIGLVQQDTQLFATSILDNIAYGCPSGSHLTAQDVIVAAKLANIHDEIMLFEDGYNTKIGERGVRLSGGQRQRIALARVFLRKPTVLLLDEATSALDAQNEALVQQSIDQLLGNQNATAVIVAHRLSTVKNAQKIVVVERGRVVQQGTHFELLREEQGRYATLVQTQLIEREKKISETVPAATEEEEDE